MTRSINCRIKLATTAALVLFAVAVLGCGSDGDDETTADTELIEAQEAEVEAASEITTPIDASDVVKTFPPTVVTDGDVEAEEEGTPQRALLDWWQSLQFRDVATVKALTSRATLNAVGEDELAELVQVGSSPQGIEVLGASETGNTASVQVALLAFSAEEGKPPPRTPTSSTPATIVMTKDGGEWLFDDPAYLQPQLESLAASQAEAAGE